MAAERTPSLRVVDHTALRINQAVIISCLLVAFVIDAPLMVGLVAALLLVATALYTQTFRWVYVGILRRFGYALNHWLRPSGKVS